MSSRRSLVATIVADRVSPSSRLISPKKSPGCSSLPAPTGVRTATDPSMMTKNESPGSPICVTTVPAGTSEIFDSSATRRSSSSSNPLKSGTRCRCRMRVSRESTVAPAPASSASSGSWKGSRSADCWSNSIRTSLGFLSIRKPGASRRFAVGTGRIGGASLVSWIGRGKDLPSSGCPTVQRHLVSSARLQEETVDAGEQLINAQRLGEDDSGGRLKELRFDGAVAVAGHEEHDGARGHQLRDGARDRSPVDLRHPHIADDQVVDGRLQPVQCRLPAADRLRGVPGIREHGLYQLGHLFLIVHHEDAGHAVSLPSAQATPQSV